MSFSPISSFMNSEPLTAFTASLLRNVSIMSFFCFPVRLKVHLVLPVPSVYFSPLIPSSLAPEWSIKNEKMSRHRALGSIYLCSFQTLHFPPPPPFPRLLSSAWMRRSKHLCRVGPSVRLLCRKHAIHVTYLHSKKRKKGDGAEEVGAVIVYPARLLRLPFSSSFCHEPLCVSIFFFCFFLSLFTKKNRIRAHSIRMVPISRAEINSFPSQFFRMSPNELP